MDGEKRYGYPKNVVLIYSDRKKINIFCVNMAELCTFILGSVYTSGIRHNSSHSTLGTQRVSRKHQMLGSQLGLVQADSQ